MMQSALGDPVRLGEGNEPRPLKVLGLGRVHSRFSGDLIADVTGEMLEEYARVLNERVAEDVVIFDWQHATALGSPPTDPEVSMALGQVVRAWVENDGLMVQPRWTPRGEHIITASDGILWPSPEFVEAAVFARESGDPVGNGQVLAITLTPRPQQAATVVDAVRLNEDAPLEAQEESGMTPEEIAALEAERDELRAKVAELEAKLAADAEEMEEGGGDASPEPAVAALREQLDTRDNEVTSLREQMTGLTAELTALREENYVTKRGAAISKLLSEGKLEPARREAAERAYDCEFKTPDLGYAAFTEHFVNAGVVVPMDVKGVSGSGDVIGVAEATVALREKAATISKETGRAHAEAMRLAMSENPDLAAAALKE